MVPVAILVSHSSTSVSRKSNSFFEQPVQGPLQSSDIGVSKGIVSLIWAIRSFIAVVVSGFMLLLLSIGSLTTVLSNLFYEYVSRDVRSV